MKGQAEVTEVITIIGLVVVLLTMIPILIPLVRRYIETYVSSSPHVVSRELATLISSVISSPYNISVTYEVDGGKMVDVSIRDRKVFVYFDNGVDANSPILIDAIGEFDDVNKFTIEKRIIENRGKLIINGKIIYQEV
ncbi:MAG: hypothetical protein QXY45_00195 [Candidatus Aenigmatarchaeota archaeon]